MEPLRNWAGNLTFSAARRHTPASVDELQALVARTPRLKAVGTRHSFNRIADTDADLVSLEKFDAIALDPARRTVTVGAGVRYGELGAALHAAGWALPNLASLPHIGVAGAVATATHGSGIHNGNLATSVVGVELVTGDGRRVALTPDDPRFDGAVVHLGALGFVTALTLALVPTFDIAQDVFEDLPLADALARFDEIAGSAYSVSLFTDWASGKVHQVWRKRLATVPPAPLPGARPAPVDRHPLASLSAESCTPQRGVPGPWHERLPHFRLNVTPSRGDELQSEYFVAHEDAADALRAVAALGARMAPHLLVSEIRTVAADDLWLSPHYRRASVGIHCTWKNEAPDVLALLPEIEAALAPFAPRPHWGKLFTLAPETLQSRYERLPEFQALAREFDPERRFVNAFLSETLGL